MCILCDRHVACCRATAVSTCGGDNRRDGVRRAVAAVCTAVMTIRIVNWLKRFSFHSTCSTYDDDVFGTRTTDRVPRGGVEVHDRLHFFAQMRMRMAPDYSTAVVVGRSQKREDAKR